jgi:hypothetical protein
MHHYSLKKLPTYIQCPIRNLSTDVEQLRMEVPLQPRLFGPKRSPNINSPSHNEAGNPAFTSVLGAGTA